jgi:hypothetical protein
MFRTAGCAMEPESMKQPLHARKPFRISLGPAALAVLQQDVRESPRVTLINLECGLKHVPRPGQSYVTNVFLNAASVSRLLEAHSPLFMHRLNAHL